MNIKNYTLNTSEVKNGFNIPHIFIRYFSYNFGKLSKNHPLTYSLSKTNKDDPIQTNITVNNLIKYILPVPLTLNPKHERILDKNMFLMLILG